MKMERLIILTLSVFIVVFFANVEAKEGETILSTVLTPDVKEKTLTRQGRSYYDPRFGPRPLYDRLEYARPDFDRPSRCGRCYDDRYDDRDDRDYDRSRDRDGDDDRRGHKPTHGNRYDRNRNDNDDDDRRYNTDRNSNSNSTDNETDGDKKRPYDDKDDRDRPSSGRHRNRNRDRDRDRYDDRDRYRPDYYDRFLSRDPYRDRPSYDRERPYYEDPYRERRPLYDRYDDPYAGLGGRFDSYPYPGYQRPAYGSRYDRGNGYDDAYGGYGPGVGRGPHDSFRPWDETYRGQAGWDAGGRGYYFASGRPEPAPVAPVAPVSPAPSWGRPDYAARPVASESGWQSAGGGYAGGYRDYRDPVDYRGSLGYGQQEGGYRQDLSAGYGQPGYQQSQGYSQGSGYSQGYGGSQAAYGQGSYGQGSYGQGYSQGGAGYGQGTAGYGGQVASGWHSVGERIRPYRDQSGVTQLDNRGENRDRDQNRDRYRDRYNTQDRYPGNRQPQTFGTTFGQSAYQSTGTYSSSSTTPQTSYLYQRDEEQVTKAEETTKAS